jgi:RNA polymerase-binding transcription factor DksA
MASEARMNAARGRLLRRLRELGERLEDIEEEFLTHNDHDPEEHAVQVEQDDVLDALSQEGIQETRMIRAALDRIDNGNYGICMRCGNPIARARLDLLPATPLCGTCAREAAA